MNNREIARLDLDGTALDRVLKTAVSGGDVGETLLAYAGEELGEDPYAGADGPSEFGTDVATLLNAVQGDEVTGSDFGEDVGDDVGNADLQKGLNQLIQAATAGVDEFGNDLGADEIVGARRRINRAAAKVRGRGGRAAPARRGAPSALRRPAAATPRPLAPPSRAASMAATFSPQGASQMQNPFTPAMNRVMDRSSPGEGPGCSIPINLPAGPTGNVAAGASVEITVRPPKDVVLTNLCIPGDIAARFAVGPITVENDNLFATAGVVPAEQFRPDSRLNRLPNKLVRGGRDIVITVRNLSGADSAFIASFVADEGDLLERARRGGGGG